MSEQLQTHESGQANKQPTRITIEEPDPLGGIPIDVRKGIRQRILGKVSMGPGTLEEAGVLRAHQAQAAEDIARGKTPGMGSEVVGPLAQGRAASLVRDQNITKYS